MSNVISTKKCIFLSRPQIRTPHFPARGAVNFPSYILFPCGRIVAILSLLTNFQEERHSLAPPAQTCSVKKKKPSCYDHKLDSASFPTGPIDENDFLETLIWETESCEHVAPINIMFTASRLKSPLFPPTYPHNLIFLNSLLH